jgi:hypothetical protein
MIASSREFIKSAAASGAYASLARHFALAAVTASLCVGTAFGDGVPDALVLPSDAHLKYQGREIMALISWGPNTYTGQEWGFGNVPTTVVTPSRLDPAQWVVAMKAAEIKSAVLVAKHHDGFCLWPSKDNVGYSMSAVPAPNTGRHRARDVRRMPPGGTRVRRLPLAVGPASGIVCQAGICRLLLRAVG